MTRYRYVVATTKIINRRRTRTISFLKNDPEVAFIPFNELSQSSCSYSKFMVVIGKYKRHSVFTKLLTRLLERFRRVAHNYFRLRFSLLCVLSSVTPVSCSAVAVLRLCSSFRVALRRPAPSCLVPSVFRTSCSDYRVTLTARLLSLRLS